MQQFQRGLCCISQEYFDYWGSPWRKDPSINNESTQTCASNITGQAQVNPCCHIRPEKGNRILNIPAPPILFPPGPDHPTSPLVSILTLPQYTPSCPLLWGTYLVQQASLGTPASERRLQPSQQQSWPLCCSKMLYGAFATAHTGRTHTPHSWF